MRRNKWLSICALILIAVLTLTACGGAQGGSAETGSSADGNSAGQAVSAASDAAGTQKADEGNGSAAAMSDEDAADGIGAETGQTDAADSTGNDTAEADPDAPVIEGLTYASTMKLDYADCFHVYYYADGYKLIDIPISGQYLVVPEGGEKPEGLAEDITVIYQPLDEVYLAATGAMSFFDRLDAIDVIKMSSLDVSGWAIQAPIDAMNAGDIVFAGKYSEPDYEMMVEHDCDLALESTMILHTPEV